MAAIELIDESEAAAQISLKFSRSVLTSQYMIEPDKSIFSANLMCWRKSFGEGATVLFNGVIL